MLWKCMCSQFQIWMICTLLLSFTLCFRMKFSDSYRNQISTQWHCKPYISSEENTSWDTADQSWNHCVSWADSRWDKMSMTSRPRGLLAVFTVEGMDGVRTCQPFCRCSVSRYQGRGDLTTGVAECCDVQSQNPRGFLEKLGPGHSWVPPVAAIMASFLQVQTWASSVGKYEELIALIKLSCRHVCTAMRC